MEWRDVMVEEIIALKQNETWELVPQPISCKWVYMRFFTEVWTKLWQDV